MAAMAPALTDAPPEAHRIRFKLAPPSTLSPNPVQSGVAPSNGAVVKRSRAAAVQPPSPDHHHHHPHTTTPVGNGNNNSNSGGGSSVAVPSCKLEEPSAQTEAPTLGRLQPLVASYLCSDVTPVPSSKESLKLQGVALLQTHGLLPGLLPRQRPSLELELSEERLRSLMSGTGGVGTPTTPVNGMAKKLAKPVPGVAALNGGSNGIRTPAGSGSGSDSPPPPLECASRGGHHGNGPFRSGEGGAADPQHPADVSQDNSNPEQPPPPSVSPPSQDPTDSSSNNNNNSSSSTDRPPSLAATDSSIPPSCSPPPPISSSPHHHLTPAPGSLGAELRERTQQSQSRQGQIEGRLRRLRKRLQVVQAKQVERHIQQQLGGLLQSTLGPLEALRKREAPIASTSASTSSSAAAAATLTPQEREGLGRFLKGGSVPAELERLSLSGGTNLHAAEGAFDSDATESSSGGETDVEEEELGRVDVEQRHVPLWRRAEGRYAVDRASIISHWNWLQAHVSDLEYRIRQQTDIYRQIRSSKGPVVLGDSAPGEPSLEDTCEVKEEPVSCQVSQDFGSDVSESSTEPGLRKACPSGKQVNGVINNLRPGSSETGDSEEQCQQQQPQWGNVSSAAPSPPDHTCVAARTRPLISCKRRRLVRPSTLTNLNRKVQRVSVCRCSCEANPQCMTCVGRSTPPLEPHYDRPLLERLSQYDPSVHPILSFSDDVMMSLHMQRLLKSHWQSRPLEKIKPIKKLSLKHKLSLGSRPSDPASSSSCSKDKHKLSNSLSSTVRLSHHKMRSEKLHRQQFNSLLSASKLEGRHHRGDRGPSVSHGAYDKTHSRKRPREHSLERMENTSKLYTDVGSPCPSLSGVQTPTHSPLLRQISTSSETSTPLSLTGQSATSTPTPIRRRRGESSFDINNIVIPMSVAATTRVEKLQYKEILTPSWREVDVCAKPISAEDDTVEVEDLTDTAFGHLHQPCQDQERSRWSWTATATAIAMRRGSRSYRSSDGRTTPLLGGTHPSTPQPSSPDTAHFHLLQDSSGAPSPSSPPSPDMLLPHTHLHAHSHRLLSSDDTRCSTPDEEMQILPPVQPWERRNFPLQSDLPRETDESQEGPDEERQYRTIRRISGSKTRSESDTGPPSPLPDESGGGSSSRHRTPTCTPKTSHR